MPFDRLYICEYYELEKQIIIVKCDVQLDGANKSINI